MELQEKMLLRFTDLKMENIYSTFWINHTFIYCENYKMIYLDDQQIHVLQNRGEVK